MSGGVLVYKVAICEDDAFVREDYARRCGEILRGMDMPCEVSCFVSAEALETKLSAGAQPFDLLLLDIRLPGRSGIALAASLRERDDRVGIIFITASAEYALEGYRAQPCDYLLKPVSDEALAAALRREMKRHDRLSFVAFPDRGGIVRLPASEILYLESFDHGIRVHTRDGTFAFFVSLARARELLPAGMFARCHNSYLVNLRHIMSASSSKVVLQNGEELPVGRTYRDAFHRVFISHFF